MLKLYSVNGQTVVSEDGIAKIIEADFRIDEVNDVLIIINETKPAETWNVKFSELQDENGSPVGTDVADIIEYVSRMSISMTNVSLGGANLDAFGRLRTSELTTQIDIKQIHENPNLFIDKEEINGGSWSYDAIDSSSKISVSSNGDRVVHQTKQRFNYQSGKSQLIMMTGYNFNQQTDVVKRIGYFSSSTVSPFNTSFDGLFLSSDSDGISINIFKSGTEIEKTSSDSWNGVKIENTSFENDFIIYLDFEWLGVGVVRWGLVENGQIKYFHISRHDSLVKGTYINTPNQPLRWEIESFGGSGSFDYICSQVSSEGAINKIGKVLSEDLDTNAVNASSTSEEYALLGIRLKNTDLDSFIDVLNYEIFGTSNDNYHYKLYLNPQVNGVFTYSDVSDSTVQVAKGATNGSNTIVPGTYTKLDSGYGQNQTLKKIEVENAIRLGSKIDGTPDEIVLAVKGLSVGLDVLSSLKWRELS